MTGRAAARTVACALAAAFVPACGSDTDPETAPRYADIDANVFKQSCTLPCHSGGEFAAGGLDMQAAPHDTLVGVEATAPMCAGVGWKRVAAGNPEESLLYVKIVAKLEGSAAPCGDTMPAGANREPLTADQVEQVRAWIAAGATSD